MRRGVNVLRVVAGRRDDKRAGTARPLDGIFEGGRREASPPRAVDDGRPVRSGVVYRLDRGGRVARVVRVEDAQAHQAGTPHDARNTYAVVPFSGDDPGHGRAVPGTVGDGGRVRDEVPATSVARVAVAVRVPGRARLFDVDPLVTAQVGVREVDAAVDDGDDRAHRAAGRRPRARDADVRARSVLVGERPLFGEARVVRRGLISLDEDVRLRELDERALAEKRRGGLRIFAGGEPQPLDPRVPSQRRPALQIL